MLGASTQIQAFTVSIFTHWYLIQRIRKDIITLKKPKNKLYGSSAPALHSSTLLCCTVSQNFSEQNIYQNIFIAGSLEHNSINIERKHGYG
jgi:hypothetical protein